MGEVVALEQLPPELGGTAQGGYRRTITPVPHCAECCTDEACPRCWLEGATIELEYPALPSRA